MIRRALRQTGKKSHNHVAKQEISPIIRLRTREKVPNGGIVMLVFRNETNRKMLENHEKAGRLRRLSSGIYSSDLETDPAVQIRQNVVRVLAYLRPGAVISHRSAILPDFGASEGLVVVTDPALSENYIHNLPGLVVVATPGPAPLASDVHLGGVYASSP